MGFLLHDDEFVVVGMTVVAHGVVRCEKEGEMGAHNHVLLLTFVQLLETFELRSEATLGGSVDNKNDLAFELTEVVRLASLCPNASVYSFCRL